MNEEKQTLRSQLRTEYRALDCAYRCDADVRIIRHLTEDPFYQNCKRLFLYVSTGNEINTRELIEQASRDGKTVALPKCFDAGIMEFYRYTGKLLEGKYHILEPTSDERMTPTIDDLMIVPGLAFDKNGYRMGQGGGYYDRYLARYPCMCIGLCRDRFILREIPVMWNDLPVDRVITESAVYDKAELPKKPRTEG